MCLCFSCMYLFILYSLILFIFPPPSSLWHSPDSIENLIWPTHLNNSAVSRVVNTHGKSPVNWETNFWFLPQGKWIVFLQLLTLQPTHAPFFLQQQHVWNTHGKHNTHTVNTTHTQKTQHTHSKHSLACVYCVLIMFLLFTVCYTVTTNHLCFNDKNEDVWPAEPTGGSPVWCLPPGSRRRPRAPLLAGKLHMTWAETHEWRTPSLAPWCSLFCVNVSGLQTWLSVEPQRCFRTSSKQFKTSHCSFHHLFSLNKVLPRISDIMKQWRVSGVLLFCWIK